MASSSPGLPMHTLLAQSGDYSDVEAYSSDNSVSDDDEHDSPRENDNTELTAAANWQHQSRGKRKQKQNQSHSDIKKSKLDRPTPSAGPSVTKDDVSEVSYVVYMQGQTTKLTSVNPLTICRDIRSTFGPVQKV